MTDRDPEREVLSLELARSDGVGVVVRFLRWPGHAWFWTVLVSPAWGLVVVRDHEVAPPRRPGGAIRADGLWCELVEETPGEHVTVALEAFGVRLDDALDAEHGEWGERLAVGLDLEWEVGRSPIGPVHGDVLLGSGRDSLDAVGRFERAPLEPRPWDHPWRRIWWQDDGLAAHTAADAAVELDLDARRLPTAARVADVEFSVCGLAVIPVGGRLGLALVVGDDGCGWLEWSEPGPP